jgi:hypothetical protein
MLFKKYFFSLCCGLAVACSGEELKNLLKNPDYAPAEAVGNFKEWSLIPPQGWSRKIRDDFANPTNDVYYLTGKVDSSVSSAIITQKDVPVKPETWYMLSSWYKADLTPFQGNNLWLSAIDPAIKGETHKGRLFGTTELGATGKWSEARAFFHSGKLDKVNFEVRLWGKGEASLGPCSMIEMNGSLVASPYFIDGTFENGLLGKLPADFHYAADINIAVATDQSKRDNQVMMVEIPVGTKLKLQPSIYIPACPGDTVCLTFKARTSMPEYSLQTYFHQNDIQLMKLSPDWKTFTFRTVIKPGADLRPEMQLTRFIFRGEKRQENTTLWFDDFNVSVIPASAASAKEPTAADSNLLINSSFEAGFTGWTYKFFKDILSDDPEVKTGEAAIDMDVAAEGTCSLRLRTSPGTFSSRRMAAALHSGYFPARAGEKFTISFKAKSNRPASFDVVLTPLYYPLSKTVTLGTEWQQYNYQFDTSELPAEMNFGYLQLQFRIPQGDTVFWMDAVQVRQGEHKIHEYFPSGELEIGAISEALFSSFQYGEKAEAQVYACSRFSQAKNLVLKSTVRDWRGNVMEEKTKEIPVPAGKTIRLPISLFSGKYGTFTASLMLSDPESGIAASNFHIYAVFPVPLNSTAEKSCLGVHNGIFNQGLVGLKGGEINDVYKLIRLIGARWDRDFEVANWAMLEPEKGKWRWYDRMVDAAIENDINILPIMGPFLGRRSRMGVPEWARSDKPTRRLTVKGGKLFYPVTAEWINYVKTFMEHYKGKIEAIEIFNETGDTDPEEYIPLAEAAKKAAKEVVPKCLIVGPAFPGGGLPTGPEQSEWMKSVLSNRLMDIVEIYSGHFYPGGGVGLYGSADNFNVSRGNIQAAGMKNFRTQYGNAEVWDTESSNGGAPPADWLYCSDTLKLKLKDWCPPPVQAERFAQWAIIKMGLDIKKIFYHSLSGSHHVNLFAEDYTPKPIAGAFAQLARRLDGFQNPEHLVADSGVQIYFFKTGDTETVVFWRDGQKKKDRLIIDLPPDKIMAEDLMGNKITFTVADKTVNLPLSESPVYVIIENISRQDIVGIFNNCR